MRRVLAVCTLGLLLGACRAADAPARPPDSREANAAAASTASSLPARPSEVPAASSELRAATAVPVASAHIPPAPAVLPRVATDWCIENVGALDEETCYVIAESGTDSLLLYLHGIVPPEKTSVQKTNLETVVANASRRAGVSALIPRGKQGLAPKGHELWWGWPTAGPTYRRHAPELIAKLLDKRKLFEERTGTRFSRVYVAGSSSGAYFAAALALHGGMKADGFAILSGGSGSETPELEKLSPKPVYIGFGKHDSVAAGARSLAALFRRSGWPVKVAEHPVPHGAREIYLDEAFAFFRAGG